MLVKQPIIFWDWNGTLLDDADLCVRVMNKMLQKRGAPAIDLAYYKEIFGFPVVDYYKQLGFDFSKDSFEDLSMEFIAGYNSHLEIAQLHPFSIEVLKAFKAAGKKQVVISAMEQTMLNRLLTQYGLDNYFDAIRGLNNIYANNKSQLAKNYLKESGIRPDDVMFIGDTLHDIEVAEEIGVDIIVVSNGHHTAKRLLPKGYYVMNNLKELLA
jgi:phosphoglycolate phosphatase